MTSKHTPGPWAWHEHQNSLFGAAGIYIIRDNGSYEGLCLNNYDRVTDDECEANKALMAASPDLLAELKRMVEHFGAFASDHSEEASSETWAALYCARAAIAKAEGR